MLKTLTFAILHFSVAFSITYLLTGSIGISSAVALVEPLANTVVFYFHEKAWRRYEQKSCRLRRQGRCDVAVCLADRMAMPPNCVRLGVAACPDDGYAFLLFLTRNPHELAN